MTENPFPSNLQEMPVRDDFVKTRFVSQAAFSTNHQTKKFQEKDLHVMGLLPLIWEWLEEVRNEFSEAVEVPVDTFATLN